MIILIPPKPIALLLGFLTGLVILGFFGSSLIDGKEPLVMDRAQARQLLGQQDQPQKAPSMRTQKKAF